MDFYRRGRMIHTTDGHPTKDSRTTWKSCTGMTLLQAYHCLSPSGCGPHIYLLETYLLQKSIMLSVVLRESPQHIQCPKTVAFSEDAPRRSSSRRSLLVFVGDQGREYRVPLEAAAERDQGASLAASKPPRWFSLPPWSSRRRQELEPSNGDPGGDVLADVTTLHCLYGRPASPHTRGGHAFVA